MDNRRPARPARPAPSQRRPLFHPSHSTSSAHPAPTRNPRAPPSTHAHTHAHAHAPVHIASETSPPPQDDLVERDASGTYKTMAPSTAMKLAVEKPASPADEEAEQEDQMIALYGRRDCYWDQAAVLEEIRGALKGSLERKVASLDVDRWMFEGEGRNM